MKPQHFTKKLSLSKQTIAHLGNMDLKNLRAGEQTTVIDTLGPDSCDTICRSIIPGFPCSSECIP